MEEPTLIFVEDDRSLNTVFTRLLERNGYRVISFTDGAAALSALRNTAYSAAIVDVNLGEVSGFDILAESRAHRPDAPVMMITAASSVSDAVRAMKSGAWDYLTKPVRENEIVTLLKTALGGSRPSSGKADNAAPAPEIVGDSPSVRKLRETLRAVSKKPVSVFLTGETGTGKELAARALHSAGPSASEPFVALNCAAIPETLFESELFGHEKGAFTGAAKDRKGKLELAGNGTLFLDEITEMPLPMQAKLLRVIQEREFEPVGGSRSVRIGARFVSASNRDVEASVRSGRFREDLYYRLNVYPIHLDPLRDRKSDIPALVSRYAADLGYPGAELTPRALQLLKNYDWPGNIRELQNAIQFALISADRFVIDETCLPDKLRGVNGATDIGITRDKPERDDPERLRVLSALKENGGNQTKAARNLGITRAQLIYKMKLLGISPKVDYE